MRASVALLVPNEMQVSIKITMTVAEIDELLVAMSEVSRWPASPFKSVLRSAVTKAREAHSSESEVAP